MLRPRLAGSVLALSAASSAASVSGSSAVASSSFDVVGFCHTHYQDYLSASGTPVLVTSTFTDTNPVFSGTTFSTSTTSTGTITITSTIVPTPYTPPAECFTGCIIDVDKVQLIYWPTPKPTGTQTGAPEITSSPALPSSVVVDGSTLVSPSNYVVFTSLIALQCPLGDSPCTTIGKPVPLTTLAFGQNELSSEECFLNFRTINYADFNYPIPWSIVSNQPGCTTLGQEPSHDPASPATGYTLNPVLQFPDEVRTAVDPLWASCSFINAAYDPPTALTAVAPPTPTPSTSQEPSPTPTPSEPASPTPTPSQPASSDPPAASSSPASPDPPAQSSSVAPPNPPAQSSSVVPPNPPAQSSSVVPPNPPAQSSSAAVPSNPPAESSPNPPAASSSVILPTPPAQSSSPAAPSNPPAESSPAASNPPPGASLPAGEVSTAPPAQPTEVNNNGNPAPATSNGVSGSGNEGGNNGASAAPSGDSGTGSNTSVQPNDPAVTQGSGLPSEAPAASSVTMSLITIVTTSDAVAGSGSETVGGQDSTGFVTGATSPANGTEPAAPTVVRSEAGAMLRGLTICKSMAIAMLFAVLM